MSATARPSEIVARGGQVGGQDPREVVVQAGERVRITADADFTTVEVMDEKGSVRLLSVGLQYGF